MDDAPVLAVLAVVAVVYMLVEFRHDIARWLGFTE